MDTFSHQVYKMLIIRPIFIQILRLKNRKLLAQFFSLRLVSLCPLHLIQKEILSFSQKVYIVQEVKRRLISTNQGRAFCQIIFLCQAWQTNSVTTFSHTLTHTKRGKWVYIHTIQEVNILMYNKQISHKFISHIKRSFKMFYGIWFLFLMTYQHSWVI